MNAEGEVSSASGRRFLMCENGQLGVFAEDVVDGIAGVDGLHVHGINLPFKSCGSSRVSRACWLLLRLLIRIRRCY